MINQSWWIFYILLAKGNAWIFAVVCNSSIFCAIIFDFVNMKPSCKDLCNTGSVTIEEVWIQHHFSFPPYWLSVIKLIDIVDMKYISLGICRKTSYKNVIIIFESFSNLCSSRIPGYLGQCLCNIIFYSSWICFDLVYSLL